MFSRRWLWRIASSGTYKSHTAYHPRRRHSSLYQMLNMNFSWRMPSSGMWRRVDLLRADVTEEHIASIIRETRIGELGTLAVGGNRSTLPRNQVDKNRLAGNNFSSNEQSKYAAKKILCNKQKQTPWPLVRERTIPTERPPLVDEI
jgi:hypothetical protein